MAEATKKQATEDTQMKNIGRLLNVELDVVVRFGVASLPLGTPVELEIIFEVAG